MKTLIGIVAVVVIVAGIWFWVSSGGDDGKTDQEAIEETTPEIQQENTLETEGSKMYSGTLPAADGPGIETTLVLMSAGGTEGGAFTLTETYLEAENGKDVTFTTSGQWVVDSTNPEIKMIVINSGEEVDFATRYYEIINADTIRALSPDGARIDSDLPYELELDADTDGDSVGTEARKPGAPIPGIDITVNQGGSEAKKPGDPIPGIDITENQSR